TVIGHDHAGAQALARSLRHRAVAPEQISQSGTEEAEKFFRNLTLALALSRTQAVIADPGILRGHDADHRRLYFLDDFLEAVLKRDVQVLHLGCHRQRREPYRVIGFGRNPRSQYGAYGHKRHTRDD